MSEEGKTDPFALIDQLNAGRVDDRASKSEGFFGEDQTRVTRDAARRERLGQLRAREHKGKRPNGGIHQFFG